MGKIAVINDLYDPSLSQVVPYTGKLIDYLQERWPEGFNNRVVRIFLNDKELAVADYDSEIVEGDYCAIIMPPADPITLGLMVVGFSGATAVTITTVITNIALALAAAVITSLFAPKQKGPGAPAKEVYTIGGEQNQLALGSVVPEHFGTLWFAPTYGSQPYTKFINGDQYLYQIMLITAGEARLDELRLGSANVNSFSDGTIT